MSNRRLIREKRETNTRENSQLRKENDQLKRQVARLRRELEKEVSDDPPPKPKPPVPVKPPCGDGCDKPNVIELKTPSGVVKRACRNCGWRA